MTELFPGLPDDPFAAFDTWFTEARRTELNDPNAMTLATATSDGKPSARIVLLKSADQAGFVFYTNTQSRKGEELRANPAAALLFHWKTLGRQIRVEGRVESVAPEEAEAYFRSRPRESRLGAWASDQSRMLPERRVLLERLRELEARFPDENVPRPGHWSGFRLRPQLFEFWQDMPFRLHDRNRYTETTTGWQRDKLFP